MLHVTTQSLGSEDDFHLIVLKLRLTTSTNGGAKLVKVTNQYLFGLKALSLKTYFMRWNLSWTMLG